jgi:hypothetical protein
MGEAPAPIVACVMILFGLPAAACLVAAAYCWRGSRQRGAPRRPKAAGFAALAVLGAAATAAVLSGWSFANAEGLRDGLALTAWGAAGLFVAGGVLGLVRPEIARTVFGTAAVLAWVVVLVGPQFLAPIDHHEVPPGPNPSSVAMAIVAFLLVFPPPAVLAALLFHHAAQRRPIVTALAADRAEWPRPDADQRVAVPSAAGAASIRSGAPHRPRTT